MVRGVLIALATFFLLFVALSVGARDLVPTLIQYTAFSVSGRDFSWLMRPWTMVTYPLAETSIISLLFGGYFFYMVGGMLERSWGSRNFLALMLAFTAISSVALMIPAYLFGVPVALDGLWMPLSTLVVAWAALDPEQEIYIWGILPVKLKYLAIADVLIIFFSFTMQYQVLGPLVAVFALAGPAAAWFYVRKMPRLNLGFRAPQQERRSRPDLRVVEGRDRERVNGFNPLRARQEREEIERLRKLLGDGPDEPPVRR